MTRLRTHGNGEAIGASANDLQRQIGLVTVDTHKHANIYFIMPNGQVGMVWIDLNFRIDLWIFGAVIRHGNQPCREGFCQGSNGCSLFGRFFVPLPQNQGTWENGRNFCSQKLSRGKYLITRALKKLSFNVISKGVIL